MRTPKVGERYLNLYNEVHEVINVSDDKETITAINTHTKETQIFELYHYTNISWYYKRGYGIGKISIGEKI